ncbi:hypothetical protein [Halorubrum sp. 2020YC2]|uniref:hypothetical protein n=1 Tax=Halorubrum sp. 2020YC2 TaxID=2836432 RepID=UPI001BE65F49|nr:hypothetical protein [Halorubrum sp. 2020YC2]QWC20498.1 hypothetical protein KI388_06025 [Halorubrum sp. 2020YC2]
MVLAPSVAQLPTYRIWGVTVVRDELFLLAALLVLWATLGRWIYHDAKDRDSDWAWQWGFGTPLTVIAGLDVMLLVVVIYLLVGESE